jgi:hypothetical protein
MARGTKPTMTAEQARSFERLSALSYAQLADQLECGCEPYRDTFTFGRWRAQGYHVRRGERAYRFQSWIEVGNDPDNDPEDGSEDRNPRLIPRMLAVFCRHQVEPNAQAEVAS